MLIMMVSDDYDAPEIFMADWSIQNRLLLKTNDIVEH